ncbi:unnamed protein product [Didymodactylos carnosus]|uniref:Alpha-(1,6)-fucosyltransferase n=1 Tax=Didymodactylos carnosus TaxID=1234261 RepID=A0A813NVI5_9BILA|nr:unnamed protein product [Didymodactylos carnosus]CAF0744343.1 unnamed protein product [Didymodactylos carnosus]CAF3499274.1 unnamed protein product [Didymodactylos carnosus]CAF3522981.1 unnamed protein product [Didymodactylos carnosus]
MWFGNKIYIFFISIWLIGLYFILNTFHTPPSDVSRAVNDRIESLQTEVDSLRKQISKLKNNVKSDSAQVNENPDNNWKKLKNELLLVKEQLSSRKSTSPEFGPGLEYEQLRRKIEIQARELSYFTLKQLEKFDAKLSEQDKEQLKNVIDRFGDQSRLLLASIRNLTKVDGYNSWREKEAKDLSNLIQARLKKLQNPSSDCTQTKRLVCNINKGCGYGCEIHHAMHCFHIAYALGRPLILLSEGWRYNPDGFDKIFEPLSNKCTKEMTAGSEPWGKNYESSQVIELPLIDNIHPRVNFLPMAIPEDLSQRLIKLTGHPFSWFTGQLMKYLLRPQTWLAEMIEKKREQIQFDSPVVGIHVRRTDKIGSEASYHDISEYMKYVQEYYDIHQYQYPSVKLVKRVFIATDDPSVFKDARSKFPDYIFYGDANISQTAQLNSRYGTESLKGVVLDIHFLSLSDYLVCTFSSQICRVAYEIMQQRHPDAAWRIQSLDDIYYFGGQNAHDQRAFISHRRQFSDEFDFNKGDTLGIEGNHWDGWSKGSDKNNGQHGLYPSYKAEDIVQIASMHTYPDVTVVKKEEK